MAWNRSTHQPADAAWTTCPACKGHRKIYNDSRRSVKPRWEECSRCGGRGKVRIR